MTDLLAAVLIAHLLGDWVLQTDHQAQHKTTSWTAMHGHCLTYHAFLGAITWGFLSVAGWAVLVGVSYVTHAVLDRRWPVRWILRHSGSPAFAESPWGVIAADQALHLSILLFLVAVLT